MPLFDMKLPEVATDSPKPEAPDKAADQPKLDAVEPKGPDQEVPPAGGAAGVRPESDEVDQMMKRLAASPPRPHKT